MKNKKGFTLIELMIVLSIIGILVAVAIPAFTETSKKTQGIGLPNITHQTSLNQSDDCKHGYIMQPNGNQMLDENGRGILCQ